MSSENKSRLISILLVVIAFLMGWQARQWHLQRNQPVHAQSDSAVFYQLQGLGSDGALSLYYPASGMIYVYPGAVVGNSILNCSFYYKVGRPGEYIERVQCPIGSIKFR
jgi:hypothetical protein